MKRERGFEMVLKGTVNWRMLIAVFCLVFALTPPLAAEEKQAESHTPAGEKVDRTVDEASQSSLNEAIDLARQRIMADPSSVKEQVALGYLLLKRGSLEDAEKTFDGALSSNARYHDALTGKGIVLARMGKDQEAEELFRKALVLNPNPVRTYFELGFLYENKGDFARAITEYKKGIEKHKQGRK
jgi:tetratricopeptide (TPR) repeat protein